MNQATLAIYANCAEAMFDPAVRNPPLDSRMAADWKILGYLTARNALFNAQALGLGDSAYYGFIAASLADPLNCIVVIRGTELPIEWLENIEAFFYPHPKFGQVEAGFWSIYCSMRIDGNGSIPFAHCIASFVPIGGTVTVIGHSLGAALATYLLADLAGATNDLTVRGALFASPKPGNAKFADGVDAALGGANNYTAAAYLRDIVPHVPVSLPFGLGFQSLPATQWIKPADAKAVIHNNPECNHNALSYAAMLGAQIQGQTCILGAN
ncbi:MAG: lipase family protein [Rudaea sp.]